jgi:hypothetical protein
LVRGLLLELKEVVQGWPDGVAEKVEVREALVDEVDAAVAAAGTVAEKGGPKCWLGWGLNYQSLNLDESALC